MLRVELISHGALDLDESEGFKMHGATPAAREHGITGVREYGSISGSTSKPTAKYLGKENHLNFGRGVPDLYPNQKEKNQASSPWWRWRLSN